MFIISTILQETDSAFVSKADVEANIELTSTDIQFMSQIFCEVSIFFFKKIDQLSSALWVIISMLCSM